LNKGTTLRTLIVDDSVVFRTFIRRCLNDMEGIEVVGAASDGSIALRRAAELKPDLMTLDLEMPGMDGLEVLRQLKTCSPDTRVIIVATETPASGDKVVQALEEGAFEAIVKPASATPEDRQALADELQVCLTAAGSRYRPKRSSSAAPGVGAGSSGILEKSTGALRSMVLLASFRPDIIAIASSTGGPQALSTIMTAISGTLAVPVVITQHMPKLFVESLASRLDGESALSCCVAEDGMRLERGHVYLAPGEMHMEVTRSGTGMMARLVDGPKVHHCKPAADPMFLSLQRLAPSVRTLALVLTGMGSDGAAGALAIAQAGGMVIAQDEASSTVWGMPGATVKQGAAHQVLPLADIAPVLDQFGSGKSAFARTGG